MTEGTSARYGFPLLAAGQAQKEVAHNEALTLIDLALQPAVRAVGIDLAPATPAIGETWVVGTAPTGDWAGRAGALAGWTEDGWRFVAAIEGMSVWSIDGAAPARFIGGAWVNFTAAPLITVPSGGGTIDVEARATLASILTALRMHRVIAG